MPKFLPASSNCNLSIQKAVNACKTLIRRVKQVQERLSKWKLNVNLTDQLKIFSKDLMGTLLREKMHHNAIQFFFNFIETQWQIYSGYCKSLPSSLHQHTALFLLQYYISLNTLLGQYYIGVAVPNSKAALTSESLI